jgi:hypothetical protein
MAFRSRLTLPVNGQQIPEGIGFPFTAVVSPEVADRLNRFDRGEGTLSLFEGGDRLSFIFSPGRLSRGLDFNDVLDIMIDQLSAFFPISILGIPGEMIIDLAANADPSDGFRVLGGNSTLRIRFNELQQISLNDIIAMYEERNYLGISVSMLRYTFQLDLRYLLAELSRGGCAYRVYFDERTRIEKASPLPLKRSDGTETKLHLYNEWTAIEKQKYGKRYKDQMPLHLQNLRGLLCYAFERDIRPTIERMPVLRHQPVYRVCALMAFLYGWHRCKLSLGLVNADDLFLNEWGSLYYSAVGYMNMFGFDIGNLFTNQSFKKVLDELCPSFAVSVLDHSRAVTFQAEGRTYVNPLPRGGFNRGEFSAALMKEYWNHRICLFFDYQKNHYIPIFNTDIFFSMRDKRLYCPFCSTMVKMHEQQNHQCRILNCLRCRQKFDSMELLEQHKNEQGTESFDCYRCGQLFWNQKCFNFHLTSCTGVFFEECFHCKKRYKITEQHVCRAGHCFRCKLQGYDHRKGISKDGLRYDMLHENCFFKRDPLKNTDKNSDTWMFDFECLLEKGTYSCLTSFQPNVPAQNASNQIIVHRHRVNYAYALPLVLQNQFVPLEEARGLAIEAVSIDDFWEKLKATKEYGALTFYAHNLKGYDGRLLMDFFEKQDIVPEMTIKAGDKIMLFTVSTQNPGLGSKKLYINFKDTLLQLQTSLKNLPKMFGLDVSIRKGDFPYLFNTPENQNYQGPLPDPSFYEVDRKKGAEKERFLNWHREETERLANEGKEWNLQTELKEYCKNDVEVLTIAFRTYCQTLAEMNQGLSPKNTVTTASYAYKVYKTLHLPEKTICRLNYDQDLFARMAMHGGKTDVRIMQVELSTASIENGFGMRYVDVQSLYPTVQYYDALPVGSPTTYLYGPENPMSQDDFQNLIGLSDEQRVFFIECDIHPTRYVHHPVIGDFIDKKFMAHLYPLKRIVLTSMEFKEALAKGYRTSQIYRVDMYKSSRDLFKTYIQTFLRLKILSSKRPFSENTSREEKDAYFRAVEEKYGFRISEDEFKENPAIRSLAKLLLNSLWGKFGEKQGRSETKYFLNAKDKQKFSQQLKKGKYRLIDQRSYGTFGWQVLCKELAKRDYPDKNVAIASFVTAHARIRLLKGLNTVGRRVVYHDTDSVIYVRQPGLPDIEEGKFLGDWESETGSQLIQNFIGLAPKTYAYSYLTTDGEKKTVVKVKGFPMDGQTEQKLTIDHFRHVLYTTVVPDEPSYRLDTLPRERRLSLDVDVDQQGQIKVPVNVFTHVYPNKQNVLDNIEEAEEDNADTENATDKLLQDAGIPFMFTTTQEKILKLDYQKGVINKADITERFGLDPRTNRIRFETLPHGWDFINRSYDTSSISIYNEDQVRALRESRATTYGEGWNLLQRAIEERDLMGEFL